MLQLRSLCFVNTAGYVGDWYCQRDSNPRRPAENRASLPLDDGSVAMLDWLPPHDSNVPVSVNSGAPSPRWLDGNENGGTAESRTPDVDLARINCSPLPAPRWCPAPDSNRPPALFKRVRSPDLLTGPKHDPESGNRLFLATNA